MRRIFIGLALALVVLQAWAQARDENAAQCANRNDPDASIRGCTALIQSGQEPTANLAADYINRAWAYALKGIYEQEFADLTKAISLDPNNADVFHYRGAVYEHRGEHDLAIKDFDESLRLRPNDAPTLDSRGAVFMKMGKFDKALSDFNTAVQYGHFINSLYARGWAKLKMGDTTGGNADIAAAKAANPNIAEKWDKYYGIKP